MFQKTAIEDASSDDDIVKTMRQRLRKLYVSPAEALSEVMQASGAFFGISCSFLLSFIWSDLN